MIYHLAIDIGASGGRHILGYIDNGIIVTKEIYRFENGIKSLGESLVWDISALEREVKAGIVKCKAMGLTPQTVAIDTWGVDYVLLDKEKKVIAPAIAYRDGATAFVQDEVSVLILKSYLYKRTGIQHQNFNTLYRLYCDKKQGRLDKAEYMLMMPEYLSYCLTGVIKHEYTNATTTNLVCADTKDWDWEIIDRLGLPRRLFGELSQPRSVVGGFSDSFAEVVGYNATVVLCPSHDTASAVAACPLAGDGVYISSGTWSLVGAELSAPVLSEDACNANFTNEGGVCGTYRFLKNIMGMWLFQGIRYSINKSLSYDEMMEAAEASGYRGTFDPNHPSLNAPDDMLEAIRELLGEPSLSVADALASIYSSLALSYAKAIKEIEQLSGKTYTKLHIMGGGSKDKYLNKLAAEYTGKKVLVGPTEATAIGNIISQMMFADSTLTLDDARGLVKRSFEIKEIV